MKLNLFVVLSLISFSSLSASEGKYPIKVYAPTDYKAGIQNIDFVQNRDMNIFVANNLGILSFNGNSWDVKAFNSGKKQRSLAFDESQNRLYVGSQGDFGYFKDNWEYVSLADSLMGSDRDFDEVWDVFIVNSLVFFCTFQHIYQYDGDETYVISHRDGFAKSFQAGGKVFTQSSSGQLFEINESELIPISIEKRIDEIVAGMIPKEDGYVIFYNSGQIEFSSVFDHKAHYGSLVAAISGTYINHVIQLSDTRLAISTQTAGIFLYDVRNKIIEQITVEDGLSSNTCLRAFQDYAGNLWVGMQNGIALVHINSPVRLINREAGLQGSGYEVFEADHGKYFSTSNGVYYIESGSEQAIFLPGTEGPSYGIQEIAGNIYVGHHTGIFQLNNSRAIRISTQPGVWQVKQLRTSPRYAVAGTYSGLVLLEVDKRGKLIPKWKIRGFDETSRFFEEDQHGDIYVGQYYKGLYYLRFKKGMTEVVSHRVSDNNDLPIDDRIILSKIDNELYIASNAGIFEIDQNDGRIVPAKLFAETIGNQAVYLLEQDNQKNIHVVAENLIGFFKQISINNYAFVPSSLFHLRYFLNNDLLNLSTDLNEGIMYSANDGLLHYVPEHEDRISAHQTILINKVSSLTQDTILYRRNPFEDKPIKLDKLLVSVQARVLKINVETFQFRNTSNQQFRYRLIGLEDSFGDWTSSATKEYTNLTEGTYEFLVQSTNYLGEVITSDPLIIQVRPPFYRTLLAKVLLAVCLIGCLILVSRIQKKRYKNKAKRIEEKKLGELEEKQQKLIEIEKQKDKELLQLEEEKVESELRHLNNLLAASTMNLVVKNEFIETIKEELKEVRRRGKNIETKKALERIEREIDTTLRVQSDWEQFEYHFDKVHGDFLTRLREDFLELTPNDQKLCAFLRLNLSTKEISNLMSISLRGVEVARYRLRKKLGLQKGQNLSKFILEY